MKIYDSPFSPNCRKVRAVAYELGLEPQLVPVNLFDGESRSPAFLADPAVVAEGTADFQRLTGVFDVKRALADA